MSEKREAVLAGAAAVFRSEGYEPASMDRIAEVAGVSKRTVYNYFPSKDALFAAVVAGLLEEIESRVAIAWDANIPVAEQLRQMARSKSALIDDEATRELIVVVLGVAISRPALSRELARRAQAGDEKLVRWLRDASRAGAMKVPEPSVAAQLFWSMVAGALFWPQLFDAPMAADERSRVLDEIVATFLSRYGVDPKR